eukprot:TRINITY_DN11931_c0_g1_i3.p1 TRINITY_DN11931_c0_g1~~TRINITY_DN11931_c0_g1_i3.p1  ORF type:complete len:198 (-),score=60.00 TRINITY_DN11931_c0_g1_i3:185-778(-)
MTRANIYRAGAVACALVALVLQGCDVDKIKDQLNDLKNHTQEWGLANVPNCTSFESCREQAKIAAAEAKAAAEAAAQEHAKAAREAIQTGVVDVGMQKATAYADQAQQAAQQQAQQAKETLAKYSDSAAAKIGDFTQAYDSRSVRAVGGSGATTVFAAGFVVFSVFGMLAFAVAVRRARSEAATGDEELMADEAQLE